VTGSIVEAGTPISLDMELIAGKGGRGRVALDGYSVELLEVDGGAYMRGGAAFFRHFLGPVGSQLGGLWLKAPAHRGNFTWIGSLTNLRTLSDAALAAHGRLRSGAAKLIGGRPAVSVDDLSSGGTLYVAATGNPYPLRLLRGASGGTISFDRWDRPVTLTAPPNAISISRLQPHN
jgi:hypothetical protein